jgi:hypothetical protein
MAVPENPIATPEQHEHERRALALYQRPEIQQTREEVRKHWLDAAKPSADMRRCFDAAFDEVMFGACVWSMNTDADRPRVITISRLPHRLGDLPIPGSRWGIDNPDSIYRVIPIDGASRYAIRGRVAERRLIENYFTLWDETMKTVDVLSGHDLELNAGGEFEISVDATPANGRRNHIQSAPTAKEFYIRDVIHDWARDRANYLSIERLRGPPVGAPRSDEEQVALTASYMRRYAQNTMRWNQQALGRPVNSFSFTIDRDTDGALRNQIYIMGKFELADDEALVLDVHLGGAKYFIAPITNIWGTTNEIVHRNGSMNSAQARPNADGTYTFVASVADPGVYNWIDPDDMHEGLMTLRWAEFDGGRPSAELSVRSRIIRLAELPAALPGNTVFVTPDERRIQLAERAASYAWRLLDR